jgi:protein CpxP
MEKDKFLIITIIILFALNLFTLGFVLFGRQSSPPPGPLPLGMERPRDVKPEEMIGNRLKFNPEQQKKLEVLVFEHRKQVESLHESSKKLHDEYFGILKTEPINTSKAESVLQQISENQKELDKATFAHFERIRELCNDDQKKLFNEFLDEVGRPKSSLPPPPR